MKRKVFTMILMGALSLSIAFGADYSKMDNNALINLAGKVAPSDYPDYKMEIHKRVLDMKVRDAQVFYDNLCETRRKAYDAMSVEQVRSYKDSIRLEVEKRAENMTMQEARQSGLIGGLGKGWCAKKGGRGYHRDGYHRGPRGDYPPHHRM